MLPGMRAWIELGIWTEQERHWDGIWFNGRGI